MDRPFERTMEFDDSTSLVGRFLARRELVCLYSLLAVGLIGLLDHVSGIELRIYPLYVLPIAVTTWRVGQRAGVAMAVLAMLTWGLSNYLAGLSLPAVVWGFNSLAHVTAFATVIMLVTYLQRSRAAEHHLARQDPLTKIPNHRAFDETATAALERQRRNRHPMTLAFIDLDNFKEVNDRHGHRVGDRLLEILAQTLQKTTRATDTLGRLGGDEFAILMPETDETGARGVLERVRAAVFDAMRESGWPVTCSIGAVTFYQPAASVDEMVGLADATMYRVKNATKDGIRIERAFSAPAGPVSIATGGGGPAR